MRTLLVADDNRATLYRLIEELDPEEIAG